MAPLLVTETASFVYSLPIRHILQGVDLRPDALEFIKARRSDPMYIKSLGIAVWSIKALGERPVTGKCTNRYDSKAARAGLTPEKLRFVLD